MTLVISTGVSLSSSWLFPADPDAAAYVAAVEAADGQTLETATKAAIDNFVIGCKADGIWNAIKASCIMAGARTLAGALVPLKGTAPTNFNFVAGDYDRKTGLKGDASIKRLDANRLGTADPQNSKHAAVYASTAATSGAGAYPIYIGTPGVPSVIIFREPSNGNLGFRCGATPPDTIAAGGSTGLIGVNRSSSSAFTARTSGANQTFTRTSEVVASNQSFWIYGNHVNSNSNARLSYYSIGEAIDLALLDARVTGLMNDFVAVIP